ncbi:unnamed protein product [Aureobasidium pullulans]|uniref:Uncharacterized protein n=1 Tax=Aureobasidium pullulans TaxID=5580 RepID=A0A4S8U8D4_AURPU|nr:hypothetical protein D6D26_08263 [Aureobasidium pullulans]THW21255.1 hypothetical protein D6D23_06514 [Aureobasidium pullulans]THW36522.1 hypothetical protein D6D22_07641 [Aureobasidium pullulans]TIA15684.1 hypothetical protein D6C81_06268 [Aureobasidium pullulans]CAC9888915.1 unnamed protein product [Aureobasidium pullulans]
MRYSGVASIALVGAAAAQNTVTVSVGDALYFTESASATPSVSVGDALYFTESASATPSVSVGDALYFTESASATPSVSVGDALYFNGSASATPSVSVGDALYFTTEVVTALTTVCPAATAGAYVTTLGKNVYTVSSATTITVKDCPCTISKPVTSAPAASACATQLFSGCNPARSACPSGPGSYITVTPSTYPTSYVVNGQTVSFTAAPTSCLPSSAATTNGVMTPSAGGNKNGTASTTKPAVYTGAAAQFGAGFGFLGAAAGAVMLL